MIKIATPLSSRLMMLWVLLAFVIQGYAVQTHIHGTAFATPHVVSISAGSHQTPDDPNDPDNCPLCQEMIHAGVYVTPVAVALPITLSAINFVTRFVIALPAGVAFTHGWQSRAPPQH